MTTKKPTTKKAQATEGKAVVYIGPTLGGGALMRNAVFRAGEFPPHIVSMREKSEALRGLFVPVSELATARKRITVRGDILNTYARQVKHDI
ncbi:hypothetical protein HMPREF9465_00215 [Sutterella wadsworthensis 2_1_59BFAA]|uniref:Uncharacterized protein n=1 Tax=Sutterella wadsworthensis 2_1_59BFAA TaxID=742823 RepID=K1JKQ7_9BURK|nr:hypothetical protein [Sutterella wadsworthensis]EKB32200.1 hypothetical protein HMPREF9465_00215 [Sutterella wadsworthensis 2_1_59BFAA]